MTARDLESYEVATAADLANMVAFHAKYASAPGIRELFHEGARRLEKLEQQAAAGKFGLAPDDPATPLEAFKLAVAPLNAANRKAIQDNDADGQKRFERIFSAFSGSQTGIIARLDALYAAAPKPPFPAAGPLGTNPDLAGLRQLKMTLMSNITAPGTARFKPRPQS